MKTPLASLNSSTSRYLILITLAFLLFGSGCARTAPSLSEEAKVAIRSKIQSVIEEGFYPGISILLIRDGEIIMREAHGVADLESGEPFTVEQLCWLASTGKLFTGTLMAALVDEGHLSFDDPIKKYFPEFDNIRLRDGSKPAQPVRIRHAMSHTSGLPRDPWLEAELGIVRGDPGFSKWFVPKSPTDFIEGCLEFGLVAEPGTQMMYGRPIDLCACVTEAATGTSFFALMEEKIFQPLELQHTFIRPTDSDLANLAQGYKSTQPGNFEEDSRVNDVIRRQQSGDLSTAGGGVFTTLDDVGTLLQLHLDRGKFKGRQLVSEKSLKKLYEAQPGTEGRYGLAIKIHHSEVNGSSTFYSHAGYSGPVAWIDFDRNLVGVLLMQSNTTGRDEIHKGIIDAIYRWIPTAVLTTDYTDGHRSNEEAT